MTRPLTRLALAALQLIILQTVLSGPAHAERRSHGWRENHYGSRYNDRPERFRPLPRTGHAMPYRPRVGPTH